MVCYCDGYHGGIPPQPVSGGGGQDGGSGCPDDLAEGQACTGTPEACDALQGTGCGQIFECKAGHWDGHRNTCYEIP